MTEEAGQETEERIKAWWIKLSSKGVRRRDYGMNESIRPVLSALRASRTENPPDEAFDVLADDTRRQLLVVLYEAKTPEPVSALTRNVAIKTDRSGEEAIKELYLRIYHVHLPKLVSVGFVEHNERRDIVGLTELGRAIARSLAD